MTEGRPLRPDDPTKIGAYRVLSRLGEGGQGVVYLTMGPNGANYAVKVLRAEWLQDPTARRRLGQEVDPTARRRLGQEVTAAAQIAPFCTASVVEAALEGDEPYVVTEYVKGPTLAQFVEAHGTLSGTDLHRLAIGTATALVAIHQAGVVHRDLKPSNVILSPEGPRVIDFGIARELTAAVTVTDRVIGTPMYMAPEQVRGETVGPAADLFAWASTVAYAAVGRAPFAAPSIAAIVHRLTSQPPDLDGVEEPLVNVLEQCLAKSAQVRPTSQQVLMLLLGQPLPKRDASDPTELLTEALAAATTAMPVQRAGDTAVDLENGGVTRAADAPVGPDADAGTGPGGPDGGGTGTDDGGTNAGAGAAPDESAQLAETRAPAPIPAPGSPGGGVSGELEMSAPETAPWPGDRTSGPQQTSGPQPTSGCGCGRPGTACGPD
ncbi:MAG: serine/threonine-protein kinase, partial [Kineosporiaceae bacterium]